MSKFIHKTHFLSLFYFCIGIILSSCTTQKQAIEKFESNGRVYEVQSSTDKKRKKVTTKVKYPDTQKDALTMVTTEDSLIYKHNALADKYRLSFNEKVPLLKDSLSNFIATYITIAIDRGLYESNVATNLNLQVPSLNSSSETSFEALNFGKNNKILDAPGCDWVPPSLETRCRLQCCAEHDVCFKTNGCTFESWRRGSPPACQACNVAVVECFRLDRKDSQCNDRLCYDNIQNIYLPLCPDGTCDCKPNCGDGKPNAGEGCDDGNKTSGDGCSSTCVGECGNLAIDIGEVCEMWWYSTTSPGIKEHDLFCTPKCKKDKCGDTFIPIALNDPNYCDDGNTNDGDGCSSTCQKEVCDSAQKCCPDNPNGPNCDKGCPDCKNGGTIGDPHLVTIDGLKYDFQGVGEYVLLKSTTDDFEIQTRQKPWGNSTAVSVNSAVALRFGGDRLMFDVESPEFRVNGVATPIPLGSSQTVGNLTITHTFVNQYDVKTSLNERIRINTGSFIDVNVQIAGSRANAIQGLMGNADGNPDNDLQSKSGQVISPTNLTIETLYKQFGDSWRITDATSLFDYETGKNTAFYTNLNFPHELTAIEKLDPTTRASAETVCLGQGVSIQPFLDNCILDVALTNDLSFIQSAKNSQQSVIRSNALFEDDFDAENGGNPSFAYPNLKNWNVIRGDIDLHNALPGVQNTLGLFVDLVGYQPGAIETKQGIDLAPGDYTLQFSLGNAGGNNTGVVSLGNLFTENLVGNGESSFRTVTKTFTVSTQTNAKLLFENKTGDRAAHGLLVDNITILKGKITSNDLVAYYPFNGDAKDASGNNNHGTIQGSVTLTMDRTGKENSAYSFDGSTGYITIPDSQSLQSPQGEITLSAWINVNRFTSDWVPILVKTNSSTINGQYGLIYNDSSKKLYFISPVGAENVGLDYNLPTNVWLNIATTFKNNIAIFYINGVKIGQYPYTSLIKVNNLPLEVGRDIYGGIEYFAGKMDEVRVYNRALSDAEILNLYQNNSYSENMENKTTEVEEPALTSVNFSAFPNPFNPSTILSYYLPKETEVSVEIYDVSGRKIATLVQQQQQIGARQLVFGGANYASGIYYARLTLKKGSKIKVHTKQLTLMK